MEFNIFSFPLEQIGWVLRQLSLSGAIGNVLAIILYILIGGIPCGIYLILKRRGICLKIDKMLWILSVSLFIVMYYMINPGLLSISMLGTGKMMLGGAFYSLLVGYLVIRMVMGNRENDLEALQRGLKNILYVVMILFAWSILAEFCVGLPDAIRSVAETNTAVSMDILQGASNLTMTYVFLTLQSVVNALPNGLGIVTIILSIQVLDELLRDSYSERSAAMIKRIAAFCKTALLVVVISTVLLNLGQIVFGGQLYQIHIRVDIPVFEILFLLVIHLLAGYIEENQRLKADNELFI